MGKHTKGDRLITIEEIEKIKLVWSAHSLQEIKNMFPHRGTATLYLMAKRAGVSCEYRQRKGKLERLLDGSPEAWYWLGFILADGHINKQGQLVVILSEKDETHLVKLANFLSVSVTRPYNNKDRVYRNRSHYSKDADAAARSMVRVAVRNVNIAPKINEILGLTDSNKTINPPTKLGKLPIDVLEYLFIGFFDGDGSLSGRIECHPSWLPVMQLFAERSLLTGVGISGKGYAKGYLPNAVRQRLLTMANVPFLMRKWESKKKNG